MAKCGVCGSRKGKRTCPRVNTVVCSLCCGQTRNSEECSSCGYFQNTKTIRNYKKIPSYTTRQMGADSSLETWSYAIEGALCKYDFDLDKQLDDRIAIKILEHLIDKYYYGDTEFDFKNVIIKNGFYFVDQAIREDLNELDKDTIVKLLGVIWFVADRRTQGGREYLEVINRYVGARITTGVRVM